MEKWTTKTTGKVFCLMMLMTVLTACMENKNAPYKDNREVPEKVMRGAGPDTANPGNVSPQEP